MKDFDSKEWYIRREGQQWIGEKFEDRIYQAPEDPYVREEYQRLWQAVERASKVTA